MTGPRAALTWSLLAAWLIAGPAHAQILHLDPIPWQAAADSTSRLALVAEVDRFIDAETDWSLNRLLLTVVLPGGQAGTFFLRMPHLTFDTGAEPAAVRWPGILAAETDSTWPYSSRVKSFGQLEVGATGPLTLPLLGRLTYGTALGLPIGVDRLYPFSSTSLPLRLEARKTAGLPGPLAVSLDAGYLVNMDSGKDDLDAAAFPSGHRLGMRLHWYQGRGSRVEIGADLHERTGRRSVLAGLGWWVPWTPDGSLGLKIGKELAGGQDRPASWYFTMAWRFDSPRYRPGVEKPAAAGKKPGRQGLNS
jgi:hypothetical protein